MRRLAPELLVTARTQRWNPEEFLRTLIQAEITARDGADGRTRLIINSYTMRLMQNPV